MGYLATMVTLLVGIGGNAFALPFVFDRTLPFPSGEWNVEAIGFGDDGFLWIGGRDTGQFYRLNPSNGAVLQSFSDDGTFAADIDVHGGILYGLDEPNNIRRFDTSTGSQLSSITGPVSGGTRGLTFLGDSLYVSGVLSTGSGDVQIGKVDATNGNLLVAVDAQDLVETASLGRIGDNLGYLVEPLEGESVDVYLNIVDALTGNLIESQILFAADWDLWGLDASDQELFVARRDQQQVWVYTIAEPATLSLLTLGTLMLLRRVPRGRGFTYPVRPCRVGSRPDNRRHR